MFVLASSSASDLGAQAQTLYTAVARTINAQGGWLLHSGLRSTTAEGFGELMERRAAGKFPWESVCPVADASIRPAHRLRWPYALLAALGYPCWVVGRRLYTIDLFNPANELDLPYESEDVRLWQVIASPNPTFDLESPFVAMIMSATESLDTTFGFGGKGLKEAVFAYRFSEWAQPVGWLRPLGRDTQLTSMSYPYMILRKRSVGDVVVRKLGDLERPSDDVYASRASVFHEFGRDLDYLLIGLGGKTLLYPMGNDRLGTKLGGILGLPYVMDRIVAAQS